MRFILNGGEAVVARTARTFLKLLEPHGLSQRAMFPAWGMSETCSGVTYNHNFSIESTSDEDPFVWVGQPTPGFQIRIVDAANRPVAEGVEGSLQVKGPSVTSGYYPQPGFESGGLYRGRLVRDRRPRRPETGFLGDYRTRQRRDHHQRR